MAEEKNSDTTGLDSKIEKASEEIEKEIEKSPEGDEKEEKKDDEVEKEVEEKEELSDEEIKNAKNLFKLLKNPLTAKETLTMMVRAAGLTPESTKQEEKATTKTIKDIVKEKLGKDYEFLSEKLSDVLEDVVTKVTNERVSKVESEIAAQKDENLKEKIAAAQQKVISEYREVSDAVLREADRILSEQELIPGKNSTPEKFFKTLIMTAAANKNVNLIKNTSASSDQDSRREKNARDVNALLSSGRVTSSEAKKSTKVKNLDDAIREASRMIEESLK